LSLRCTLLRREDERIHPSLRRPDVQYALLIYEDETFWNRLSPQEMGDVMAGYQRFGETAGERLGGGAALHPTATATTLSVRDGERLLTDGPFAETREQLGGFYLLECPDLDTALGWAAQVPELGAGGSVEVRPVMDYEAAGYEQPGAEATQS
jgi:hypothetical protein